jgi:hypothetical protein
MRLYDIKSNLDESIEVGDHFDIEIGDMVIESTVVGLTKDGVIIEADNKALALMKVGGALLESVNTKEDFNVYLTIDNPDFGKDEITGREELDQIEVGVNWSSYQDEFEIDKVVNLDTGEDITQKVSANPKLYYSVKVDVLDKLEQQRARGDNLEEANQYGEGTGTVTTSNGKLNITYRFQINSIKDQDGDDITAEMSKDPWGTRYLKQAVFHRIADSEPLKIGQNKTVTTTDYKGPKVINYDFQLVSATGPRGDDVTELLLNSPSARNHFLKAFFLQQAKQMSFMKESDSEPLGSREASFAASALSDKINKNLDSIRGYVNDMVNYAKVMTKKYAGRGVEGADDTIANVVSSYENLKRAILALRNPYDAIATGSPERYLGENVEDIPGYTKRIKQEIYNLQQQLDRLFQLYSAMATDVKEPKIATDMANSLKFIKDPQTKINKLLIAIENELLDPFDMYRRHNINEGAGFNFGKWWEQYEKREDNNYHTENALEVAKLVGHREDVEVMNMIMKLHNKFGHMHPGLAAAREKILSYLWPKVEAMYKEWSGGQLNEAKYQGREVPLSKPMQGDVKKFKVYVKNEKGNVVKVNFGDKNMKIKKSNPARRKSFRARHNCANPGPKTKARYWSCRKW